MKKNLKVFVLILILVAGIKTPLSQAYTFNDPINTAINTLRNTIMQAKWVKELALAVDRLKELKSQTFEMIRFHSGLDEIFGPSIGDPLKDLFGSGKASLRDAFMDAGFITPRIEIADEGAAPQDIRMALEEVTGTIPEGNIRPDIVWTEANIVNTFQLAQKIRDEGEKTRDQVNAIAEQARSASPKGAARIQAQLQAQTIIHQQTTQELLTEVMKGQAMQMAQVNRQEKEAERQRLKFVSDASEYLEGILGSNESF